MTKFSENQVKAIEALAIPDAWRSYEGISKSLGIAESTLYRWRQKKDFQDAVIDRSLRLMGDEFAPIVAAHIRKAKTGDMGAIKEYYERILGKVKIDVNIDQKISMNDVASVLKENYTEGEIAEA